ncbi:MAG: hypothetical protein QG657_3693, partial [Acidobacteriota bacterium]|nr:hypothetical protein [Acidobacteriota bacterium]
QSMRTDLRQLISMADEQFAKLMTTLTAEARYGPRLLSLTPLEPGFWNKPGWLSQKIRLTLWCEHSRIPLPELCKDQSRGVYEFDRPRKWLKKAAPYVRFVAGTLRLILPVAGSAVKWALDDAEYKKIDEDLDLSQKSFDALLGAEEAADKALIGDHQDNLPDVDQQEEPCDEFPYGHPTLAQVGLLRELHALIQKRDPSFGGLVRVRNKRGEFLWVHPDFQKEY